MEFYAIHFWERNNTFIGEEQDKFGLTSIQFREGKTSNLMIYFHTFMGRE